MAISSEWANRHAAEGGIEPGLEAANIRAAELEHINESLRRREQLRRVHVAEGVRREVPD